MNYIERKGHNTVNVLSKDKKEREKEGKGRRERGKGAKTEQGYRQYYFSLHRKNINRTISGSHLGTSKLGF